jgi:hypothetical protein
VELGSNAVRPGDGLTQFLSETTLESSRTTLRRRLVPA